MKKKFLSLMMAAAMVATTSVSAFAANDKTVTNDGDLVEVKINGIVNDSNDQAPAGTLSVTVPTALSFTVSSAGKLTGSNINVVNNGTQAVDVYAYQFKDTTPTTGIVVKNDEQLSKKSDVGLRLNGNTGTAYFKSEAGNGVYDEGKSPAPQAEGIKISNIGGGNDDVLYLQGDAGKGELEQQYISTGMSERFTLRLKIKKAAS